MTPVYIFDSYDRFVEYYEEINGGKQPGTWVWAYSKGGTVYISLEDRNGDSVALKGQQFFYNTIVHEMNHALLIRLMGWTTQPQWFKEGLAEVAASRFDPEFHARKMKMLRPLFESNSLVPIEEMEDYDSYTAQTEKGESRRKRPKRRGGTPDTYTQSYAMVKYLVDGISTAQLQSFLNRVCAHRTISAVPSPSNSA